MVTTNTPRPTPEPVLIAIRTIATYLRRVNYADAIISPSGEVSFGLDNRLDRLVAWGNQLAAANTETARLRAALTAARRPHAPGCWHLAYPKAQRHTGDGRLAPGCTCGADAHNAALDAVLGETTP